MNIPILVVDDYEDAFTHVEAKAQEHGFAVVPWGERHVYKENAFKVLCEWIKKTREESLCVILDLKFDDNSVFAWSAVKDVLDKAEIASLTHAGVPETAWGGLAIGKLLIETAYPKTVLYVVTTSFGELTARATRFLDQLSKKSSKSIVRIKNDDNCLPRNSIEEADALLALLRKKWVESFGRYHRDDNIDRIVRTFGKPIIESKEVKYVKHPWHHDSIDTYSEYYCGLLHQEIGRRPTTTEAKALGMCVVGEDAKTLCSERLPGRELFQSAERPISKAFLKSVLDWAELPAAGIDKHPRWGMPCVPAFPFFAALRAFAVCAQTEGAPLEGISWHQHRSGSDEIVYRLEITLARERLVEGVKECCNPFGLGGFLKKSDTGLSGSLWNLLWCRTVLENAGYEEPQWCWRSVFSKGPVMQGTPCMGITFGAYTVHLFWT